MARRETEQEGFSDLLQAAELLTVDMDGGNGELPRLRRNMQQVLETGQQLWQSTTASQGGGMPYVKASILLGSKGLDLPRLSQKLDYLDGTSAQQPHTFDTVEQLAPTDLQGFLSNERKNIILNVIEDTRKATFDMVDSLLWDSVNADWEKRKRDILGALADVGDTSFTMPAAREREISFVSAPSRGSSLDQAEMAYAREIVRYNEAILHGGGFRPDIFEKLSEAAKSSVDDKVVAETWDMVSILSDVAHLLPGGSGRDISKTRSQLSFQKEVIAASRSHLENCFKKYIHNVVYGNLLTADLGGIPGTAPLVRSFVSLRGLSGSSGLEDSLVEGQPVWPFIYYCLRCGDMKAAMQVARQASAALGDFHEILQEFHQSNRRLSMTSESKIRLEYKRSVRASTDPYKRIVYCLIGYCDVNDDHREVATTIDDYLWIKLSQLSTTETESIDDISSRSLRHSVSSSSDILTLSQLQHLLLEEYGEIHFAAHQKPFTYFQVLFLTGQFEAAIGFLAGIDPLRVHATHIAIALHVMGLLILPKSVQAPLLSQDSDDSAPMRRLNLARLVMLYTKKFECTDPKEALHYFYFLRNIQGPKENMFASCVSVLVQESREFDLLLGQMQEDGCRTPGLVDHFAGVQVDVSNIIATVAADSEARGLFEDAIKLYDLAHQKNRVVELLNTLLSQAVADPQSAGSKRERFRQVAISVARRYQSVSGGEELDAQALGTFRLLLDLMNFFDHYHGKNDGEALSILQELSIVPLRPEDVESKVAGFRMLREEARRSLPDILLAAMNILYNRYRASKTSSTDSTFSLTSSINVGKDSHLSHIRSQARALIMFAGMIPYRLPGDTNARLVQLEILMN